MNKLMDGYDVVHDNTIDSFMPKYIYRVYQIINENNRTVKIYRFGYPDYKSMIDKHPELDSQLVL